MRLILVAAIAASLCGCGLIYKLPTRQGNVIDQDELNKVEVGMTRDQVKFVLGTPMAASSLQPDRWDYLGYYKSPRGKTFSRKVTLYFEGDRLARMEGAESPASEEENLEQVETEGAKERAEASREDEKDEAGIIVRP